MIGDKILITIRLFAALREAVGERAVKIPFSDGLTVKLALETLVKQNSNLLELLYQDKDNKKLNDFYHILVNGMAIERQDGLDTKLNENDIISILPPVGGG